MGLRCDPDIFFHQFLLFQRNRFMEGTKRDKNFTGMFIYFSCTWFPMVLISITAKQDGPIWESIFSLSQV